MEQTKCICVIGAGASGLPAIKCCIDEELEVVCYERSHDIGGLWRYEDGTKEGATVYKSTYINTSKELMCYSDFPIPGDWANYMHHSKVLEYYRRYAKKFDLLKYIHFNTEVVSCQPCKDDESKWLVTVLNQRTNTTTNKVFDGILVAVGHHAEPYFPWNEFSGIDNFEGQRIHSKDYRTFHGYENKNVLIVGLGNSAGDIAVELSWHANQVYLSTRRGGWVFNRVGPRGVPVDFTVTTRFSSLLMKIIPEHIASSALERELTKKFDHAHYGLKPVFGPFNQHPIVNDDLPNRILNGSIKIKSDISEFSAHSVQFVDGSVEKVDMVIFATGFKFSFPFLGSSVLQVTDNAKCDLYKYMWPLTLRKPNLAIIGHIQALGAVNPISELQCRWATRVMKGLASLPSVGQMKKDIEEKRSKMKKQYYESRRYSIQVYHVDYVDQIAEQIGVKPNLFRLILTDPQLAYKVFFEICSPYQFRLTGPGKWDKAREMIMTQKQRMYQPLHSRQSSQNLVEKTNFKAQFFLMLILSIILYRCIS